MFALLSFAAPGCDLGQGSSSPIDFPCVVQDERLGTPFTDPDRARAWVRDTVAYLQDMNAQIKAGTFKPGTADLIRLADLADLAERAGRCIR